MMYNVPQFVDIEDKVAGPLTWRQLFWMIGMGAILLVIWNIFTLGVFIAVGIPIALAFVALAFYRPYGQPLVKMVYFGILFIFRPKMYTWYRLSAPSQKTVQETIPEKERDMSVPIISLDELTEMAGRLDRPNEALTRSRENDTMRKL